MELYHDDVSRHDLGFIFQTLIAMGYCKIDYGKGIVTYLKREEKDE